MNAFQRFATAMSHELFTMKAEDLPSTTLYIIEDHLDDHVPADYVTAILDDPLHISAIKERLRASVLEDVQSNPDDYDMCGDEYVYSGNIFDHAALVDAYIQNQYIFDNPEFHTRHICSECGSDNVQVKAWVRPNKNNQFIAELYQGDDPEAGFCNDCGKHVFVDTAEVNVRHKVIGFQVVKTDGSTPESPIVYALPFCLQTLRDNPGYKLKAVWTGDWLSSEPTLMFEGDPRNPTT